MPDYTLLETALELGGIVTSVAKEPRPDLLPFERAAEARPLQGEPALRGVPARAQDAAPLSKPHICPHVEYRAGASLLRVHVGGEVGELVGGGLRGVIKGFSDESRRRLLETIGCVRRDAELPLFVTLTYPESFPEPKQAKVHLRAFLKRLGRSFPSSGLIWKLEPQERGAPHFHMLTWGCGLADLREFVPLAWFEIAGGGDQKHLRWHRGEFKNNSHCVQEVRSWNGVWAYAAKYLGKTFEVAGWSEKWTGRYWGVASRSNVPFGELVEQEINTSTAYELMRYQRRFTGKRSKYTRNKSSTVFCDADQWVTKAVKKRTA